MNMEDNDSYSNMKLPDISNSQLLKKWDRYDKSLKKRKINLNQSTQYLEATIIENNYKMQPQLDSEEAYNKTHNEFNSSNKSKVQSEELSKITRDLVLKSKERAKRNRAVFSRKTYKNYKRLEEQRNLKEENLRLLKRLQNSHPTYNYDSYDEENKKK